MYVIAGVTGHVGSVAAKELIAQGKKVKVLVRDAKKGTDWSHRGAEVAVGTLQDEAFLTTALKGAQGLFVLLPPNLAATDILADQKKTIAAVSQAVTATKVPHVVLLSSIGADLTEEDRAHFGATFLRGGAAGHGHQADRGSRRHVSGEHPSVAGAGAAGGYLSQLLAVARDSPIDGAATADIGRGRQRRWRKPKAAVSAKSVDLQGPAYTVTQLAHKLGGALGKTLNIVDIPEAGWLGAMTQGGLSPTWANAYLRRDVSRGS